MCVCVGVCVGVLLATVNGATLMMFTHMVRFSLIRRRLRRRRLARIYSADMNKQRRRVHVCVFVLEYGPTLDVYSD